MLIPILCALLISAEPATAPARKSFTDPNGRWSVEIPADWAISDRFARRGIFQFDPPDSDLQMTVSRAGGLVLPDQPEIGMLDMAFPDAEPVNDPTPMRGDGWLGLFRTYVEKTSEKTHIGLVAMRDDELVLVTVSSPRAFTDDQTRAIAGILARLRLHDPPATTAPSR